jgi:hypothetical protein
MGLGAACVPINGCRGLISPALEEHPPAVDRWTDYFAQTRMIRGGATRAVAEQQGMGQLTQMVHNQARGMAYLDAFLVFAIMAMAALPRVLLIKKSVAKGGLAVH